jgi:hypothetical protein
MDCGYKFAEVNESLRAERIVYDAVCHYCDTVKEDVNPGTTAMYCNACGMWFRNTPVRRAKA